MRHGSVTTAVHEREMNAKKAFFSFLFFYDFLIFHSFAMSLPHEVGVDCFHQWNFACFASLEGRFQGDKTELNNIGLALDLPWHVGWK